MCVCAQELSVLQINSEGQLKAIETDLLASRATVSALKERNKDLGKLYEHVVLPMRQIVFTNEYMM